MKKSNFLRIIKWILKEKNLKFSNNSEEKERNLVKINVGFSVVNVTILRNKLRDINGVTIARVDNRLEEN